MTSLFSSIGVYRVFFHKLRSFPGPYLARVSKLWHVWKCVKSRSRNHLILDDLYKQYGDFVRTGPREITVFHPDILYAIDGPGTKCSKTDWYDILLPEIAINTARDKSEHDHRRKIWNRAFTTSALAEYQHDVVAGLAGNLEEIIEKAARDEEVVRFDECAYWFGFDVMGQFAFTQSFHMLKSREWHHAVSLLRATGQLLGTFSPVPWLSQVGFQVGGNLLKGVRDWNEGLGWCRGRMAERIKSTIKKRDISSYLIEESQKMGSLEQDRIWLNSDAITMVVAGSETTSATLIFLFNHLARDPIHQLKLFNELAAVPDISNHAVLQNLPHLNGVINETLRLHPPVPTGGNRETPPEGITVAGTYIPGNTNIVAPRYTIARLETCFKDASSFIPERWYNEGSEMKGNDNRKGFAPFGIGRYGCVGKQLALAELRLVTALLVKKYKFWFAEGGDGQEVFDGMIDKFTVEPGGELKLKFRLRSGSTPRPDSAVLGSVDASSYYE
ncbi:cytochrome P450 [Periconia macrospinosa]|uniref:Cytochrome P450 n=1 Tax=Periconia macrospinosa TaxID=97972 RepID=A0A2V1E5F8_9PLEO|nr:cytochrome P450 [Periconia macrospinosa]